MTVALGFFIGWVLATALWMLVIRYERSFQVDARRAAYSMGKLDGIRASSDVVREANDQVRNAYADVPPAFENVWRERR